MNYVLTLSGEQTQQVMNALSAFPYREVHNTIKAIESQVAYQNLVRDRADGPVGQDEPVKE